MTMRGKLCTRGAARGVWALVIAVLAGGCAPKHTDLKAFLQAHRHDVTGTSYRVEPPDVIAIESPNCPEVDGEAQRIRSDGKISLRLVGDVQVTGLEPREIGAKIEDLLSRYYNDPKVTVRVVSHESKHVYAFGQVTARGAFPFTGRDTVLDLLSRAQPDFLAWKAQVKVIRPSANPNERHEITINVDKMIESGDLTENFLLQAGDIVYVPPTPLGWAGLRIQELLFPISPALTTYQTPQNFRNATYEYKYGGSYRYYDGDDSNDRRRLLWLR